MPENNIELSAKLEALEARNSQLAAEMSILASRSQSLSPEQREPEYEIDLRELWNAIWSGKLYIVGITSTFAFLAVVIALILPNEYKSTTILAPASSSSSSSLAKLAGQFGGLASLAGIDLAGASEDKTTIAIEIMKTWGFLERFIEDNEIQVEVFAAEGWNRSTNELVIDSDLYDRANKKWVRIDYDENKGQTVVPSSWELFEEIEDRIEIVKDERTGLITLSVEYYSPIIAKEWTDNLVKAINAHIQKQDREEAIKSIEYLNNKINETNIADMQSVFYQLIEEQTKNLMLAEVSEEYVFKVLSFAKIAEEKSAPKRVLISLIGIFVGGLLAILFVLIRHFSSPRMT